MKSRCVCMEVFDPKLPVLMVRTGHGTDHPSSGPDIGRLTHTSGTLCSVAFDTSPPHNLRLSVEVKCTARPRASGFTYPPQRKTLFCGRPPPKSGQPNVAIEHVGKRQGMPSPRQPHTEVALRSTYTHIRIMVCGGCKPVEPTAMKQEMALMSPFLASWIWVSVW